MQGTIDWIRIRGVKYCPAPFLPSLAAFSSNPSNAAAFTSTPSSVHWVSSMSATSFLRFTGLANFETAPAKISPSCYSLIERMDEFRQSPGKYLTCLPDSADSRKYGEVVKVMLFNRKILNPASP
jgi:hypothetical protein